MAMFGGNGSWSLSSAKDPRWNCDGSGWISISCTPDEVTPKIEELKKLYGEPPDDLEFSCMKD